MCKVIKNIQGKNAEQVLNDYGVIDTIPIDLNKLLQLIGIASSPYDFTALENTLKKGEILGLVLSEGEKAAILYRNTDSVKRQRFTIAHELAHCCLSTESSSKSHVEYRLDNDDKTENEIAADIFTGELLIPLKKLAEVYLLLDYPFSTILANKFGVSVAVMEARLNYLKISHFDSKGNAVQYGI